MNNSINLLDYKNKIHPKAVGDKQKRLRIIAVSLLFIVSVSSLIFFIFIALSPLPQLRSKEKIASFNLSLANPDIVKLAMIKQRAEDISEIIDKRAYFDRLLNSIQSKLPSGVVIDTVNIEKNNLSIILISNSLKQLDDFINELAKDGSTNEFSNIKIVDLSASDKKNEFLLTLVLNTL